MTIAGELINILGFKLEGQENLTKFNDGMDKAEGRAKTMDSRIKALAATAGLTTTGMIATGTAAVKNFASFEREMNRIGITADATSKATVAAGEEVQRLAKQFAMPVDSAVGGLDTLVASGMSLEGAMAFLPSVLATAQASGAAVNDVANTALKSASALKLEASEMQRAFDVMVTGGKAGQFEMRDMASYIPTLANSFANLGYSGEDGLKRLIAILQTIREDTGTAGQAATQAQNIFSKMFSAETEKNFAEFGVKIREEVDAAVKNGEGAVEAYVRISRRVMKENPTAKLVDLFADQEFQLGMQSLMTSAESYEKFLEAVNSGSVDGTVLRDLQRIVGDTQASIDNLSGAWDGFLKGLGGNLSGPVATTLNSATDWLAFDQAITKGLEKRGMSYDEQQTWRARNWFDPEDRARVAREGGYISPTDAVGQADQKETPYSYEVLGRRPRRPTTVTPEGVYDASRFPEQDPGWMKRFLFGKAVDGVSLRDALKIEIESGAFKNKPEGKRPAGTEKKAAGEVSAVTKRPATAEKVIERITDRTVERTVDRERALVDTANTTTTPVHPVSDRSPMAGEDPLDGRAPILDASAMLSSIESKLSAIDLRTTGAIQPTGEGGERFKDLAARIENMNSTLAKATSSASAEAVITDNRQDNRNQSVTVEVGGVTVNGVQNVSAAVGAAVGSAVGNSAATSATPRISRAERDDAF